jgi:hypothetical protein
MAQDVIFASVRSFDGATLVTDTDVYDMGSFLGGGAAGTVYEAVSQRTQSPVAVKIVNPIGYKLAPPATINRCQMLIKVRAMLELAWYRGRPSTSPSLPRMQGAPLSPEVAAGRAPFTADHVSWLFDNNSRQLVTAYAGAWGVCVAVHPRLATSHLSALLLLRPHCLNPRLRLSSTTPVPPQTRASAAC